MARQNQDGEKQDFWIDPKDKFIVAMKHENIIRKPYFLQGMLLLIPGTLLLIAALVACRIPEGHQVGGL